MHRLRKLRVFRRVARDQLLSLRPFIVKGIRASIMDIGRHGLAKTRVGSTGPRWSRCWINVGC